MRSISASTCAISCCAWGESIAPLSSAPGASAPSVAAAKAPAIDRSARRAFIWNLREPALNRMRTLWHRDPIAMDAPRSSVRNRGPCLFLPKPGRFEEKPGPPLGLVDPVLDQARAGHVVVLVANGVRFTQTGDQLLVVVAQLGEHVEGRHEICVIVEDTLEPPDLTDRAQRRAADLPYALGDRVRGGEDLVGLLVQEKMIIAEVRTRHVPMEVLRLHVEREYVGKQHVERGGDNRHRRG